MTAVGVGKGFIILIRRSDRTSHRLGCCQAFVFLFGLRDLQQSKPAPRPCARLGSDFAVREIQTTEDSCILYTGLCMFSQGKIFRGHQHRTSLDTHTGEVASDTFVKWTPVRLGAGFEHQRSKRHARASRVEYKRVRPFTLPGTIAATQQPFPPPHQPHHPNHPHQPYPIPSTFTGPLS